MDQEILPRHQIYLVPFFSEKYRENVADQAHGARVIRGDNPGSLLNGDTLNYDAVKNFTSHTIPVEDHEESGILVQLGEDTLLNYIQLLLWDRDQRVFSYYVEVATENKPGKWSRICDFTKYDCRSWQRIPFSSRVIRYIKIVGTRCSANRKMAVVALEAYHYPADVLAKEVPLNSKWNLIDPQENVCSPARWASVVEGASHSRNTLIDGRTTGHGFGPVGGVTEHIINTGQAIVVRFAQPYVLSSMRLLLFDCDVERTYSFYVEVSTNGGAWELICDRSNEPCKSWQEILFEERPVVYVRIVGTRNSKNGPFHVVHLECPSSLQLAAAERRELVPIQMPIAQAQPLEIALPSSFLPANADGRRSVTPFTPLAPLTPSVKQE